MFLSKSQTISYLEDRRKRIKGDSLFWTTLLELSRLELHKEHSDHRTQPVDLIINQVIHEKTTQS